MFLVKHLGNFLWGQSDSGGGEGTGTGGPRVVLQGTFYQQRQSQWACLYLNAEASFLVTGGSGSSGGGGGYTLVVNKIDTEEDQPEKEEEEEEEEQLASYEFVLSGGGGIAVAKEKGPLGQFGVSWTDIKTNKRFLLETQSDSSSDTSHHQVDLFVYALCQCLYEAKYQKSHETATDSEINQFFTDRTLLSGTTASTSNLVVPSQSKIAPPVSVPPTVTSTPITKSATNVSGSSSSPGSHPTANFPPLSIKEIKGEELFQSRAMLYLFDEASKEFKFVDNITASLHSTGDSKNTFGSNLYIAKPGGPLLFAQEVNNDMFVHFNEEHRSVIWVYCLGSAVWTWSLILPDSDTDRQFKDCFATCLWERNSHTPFSKVKKEDVDWILHSYSNKVDTMEKDDGVTEYDMMDFIEPEEEKKVETELEDNEEEEEEEEEDESDEEVNELANATNSLLSVGYSTDRSFVVRGSQIGVFKADNNKLKYSTSIKKLKDSEGKHFSPRKIMLHQQDSSMLMLHPDKNNRVYRMDLNRADVVEEWKAHDFHPIKELFPQTKYSQVSNEATLLGLNDLGFMTIDPRLPKEKVVDSKSFFYKPSTKPQFSCAATTGSGHLAVGSKNGDIRLYTDKNLQTAKKELEQAPRAKTQLPGFGDPIIGIDVTEDGTWILATCKSYLLVIPTSAKGTTGFEKPMGTEKPVPRRLQLKREHIAQMGGKINFTTARFNIGNDQERSIVTSTGPYVITWNFRKVRQNILDEYQIRQYKDDVVADQFKFGDEKSIVVTLKNDVLLAKKGIKRT